MELFDYEKRHVQALRDSLAECTVLLKKDGHFPLKAAGPIAAYGSGVRHTIKGGTGSGEVNSRYFINVEQGLTEAGFTITTGSWLDAYDQELVRAKEQFIADVKAQAKAQKTNVMIYGMGKTMPEPEYQLPLEGEGDTAIYVVSRNSGEGNDRKPEGGDIQLTATEKRDILALNEQYDNFMLVLNVGGVVDLSAVMEVKNILVLSQLGVETGSALADILLGKSNPSGCLTTTWAAWEDYAPTEDFEDLDDTRYREGIYVGYRYFDTFGKKALFPFGYGLSYTEFDTQVTSVSAQGDRITVEASVANIGPCAGKHVVQCYLSAPSGKLDQPYQELCGFAKSGELAPGAKEMVTITFAMTDMASYDMESAAYLLEAGNYLLRVGDHSAATKVAAIIVLDETVTVLQAKNVLGTTDFEDLKAPQRPVEMIPADVQTIRLVASDLTKGAVAYEAEEEILPEVDALSVDELCYLNIGAFDPKKNGVANIIGNASASVCGAAGETTSLVEGFPHMVMADGPAGLRLTQQYFEDEKGKHGIGNAGLPESMMEMMNLMPKLLVPVMKKVMGGKKPKADAQIQYQYCTAIPIGTAIAQSFNIALAECYGDIVGTEMEMFGVHLWLAPALNIHRSIRCGRNFEYYSEDPLVSGMMAAGITRGVQQHKGCGTTIKHYAANNKEYNRYCNDSIVSERAMRQIYTKGFGICVRESQPKAVMTSYNLLNGQHTAEHRGLIEDILRREYGFAGIVMTDWVTQMAGDPKSAHRNSLPEHVAAAGGDLFMPGGKADFTNLKKGIDSGVVSLHQVKVNATRVLKMARELTNS